ncbi:hypothetical protein [Streptomyces cinereoruber]|uniref:hypothetical protein n=1 Tax=Streptomyces cinereoruber TaxID=67260 RepID=UPI003631538B
MKQLVAPNLDIHETAGWCLRFTERVFRIIDLDGNGNTRKLISHAVIRPTAWSEWEATKFKHSDRNFPKGVSFPVFFDWYGDVGDGWRRYGHAAIVHSDGKVYSSPLSGRGRAWFATVDDLCRAFGGGMRYVGWSKDLAGVRIIKEEDMPEKMDLNTLRIVAAMNWQWNGKDGRPDAHAGQADKVLQRNWGDVELTNANLRKMAFESQEASDAFKIVNEVFTERDTLRKKLADIKPGEAEQKLQAIKDALGVK